MAGEVERRRRAPSRSSRGPTARGLGVASTLLATPSPGSPCRYGRCAGGRDDDRCADLQGHRGACKHL